MGDCGYVYLIKNETESIYKIGVTKNDKTLKHRLINLQTGSFGKLTLIHKYKSKKYKQIEFALHNFYKYLKVRGEWFEMGVEDEFKFISECEKIDANLKFLEKNLI